ncbi:hypothetical protein KC19_2G203600 [Ceratodon purpureus]|uniref:Uncharacterized protein n=1 Tax=Ceratodon purpureus TaxID=3225 RepID=A0A8T0IXK4_CERPU|nr:hypothetical protein KC19_2G203600 [Ceratodon purpureus]
MGSGGKVHMMAPGWRAESQQGGVWRQAMWGLVMGLCVGAVAGAPAAMQPTSSSSSSGDNGAGGEVGCERPITDVIVGFGLSLLATFLAAWNVGHHRFEGKLGKLIGLSYVTLVGPMMTLMITGRSAVNYVRMIRHLHKMRNEEMTFARIWDMLNPLSKSPTRFLASCTIIMYVREGEQSVLLRNSWLWKESIDVEDESEAMVVGEELKYKRIDVEDGTQVMGEKLEKRKKIQYQRKELSVRGIAVLIWGEYFSPNHEKLRILPEYGQLKYLRANSGFAVIAIGIQAAGYIYAVMFRSAKDLRVAPVEVIGLVINIMLLIGVILYGTSNPCARPLVIYMDKEREEKYVNAFQLKSKKDFKVYEGKVHVIVWFFVFVLSCIPILVYFIVTLRRATSRMIVLPIIIFAISLLVSALLFPLILIRNVDDLSALILSIVVLSNVVAYVWAVIVTFRYWKSHHFNTRPHLIDFSQFIPFIG